MKKTKRSISLILTIAMFITAFAFTGSTVYAASGISSLPVTIKSYPISTGNNTPAYSYQGASSKSGTIYAADYCTINNIYSNGYIRVTYPTSGNKTRRGRRRIQRLETPHIIHHHRTRIIRIRKAIATGIKSPRLCRLSYIKSRNSRSSDRLFCAKNQKSRKLCASRPQAVSYSA